MEKESKIIIGERIVCTPQNSISSSESGRMSYIVLRGRWCNIIVLNVHEQSEEKSDDSRDSFYEELEQVFYHFAKYHTKIPLGDFNIKLKRYFQTDNWE